AEAEKEQQRLGEDAERWRLEAEAEEQRRIEAETEMQRLREAMEAEQRRIAEEAEDQVGIAAEAERLRFEAERRAIFDRNAQDAIAAADDSPPSDKGEADRVTRPPIGNPIEELIREAEWRVRVPNEYAKEPLDAPPVPDPAEHDEEAMEIADEVGKILQKRRWARRESPFDGFKSPPGRF
ncbi:MAG TPA: hypothetical protein VJL07_03550, partial [Dehalococcoidia bacterium]|nr:hypothetical protein [Dehalococcoidia bacterium]